MSIGCGALNYLGNRHIEDCSEARSHGREKRGLIAPAPVRHRRKIGGIGFEKHAIETRTEHSRLKTGIFEGHYSVEAEIEVAITAQAVDVVGSAGETVEQHSGNGLSREDSSPRQSAVAPSAPFVAL